MNCQHTFTSLKNQRIECGKEARYKLQDKNLCAKHYEVLRK